MCDALFCIHVNHGQLGTLKERDYKHMKCGNKTNDKNIRRRWNKEVISERR